MQIGIKIENALHITRKHRLLKVVFTQCKLQDFEMPMTQHLPGISEILDQINQDGTLNTWECIYWEVIIDGKMFFRRQMSSF